MSESTVKAGGIAGLLAGALFVSTAVLSQLAPVDAVYDSATEYAYLGLNLVAFLAVGVTVGGIRALLSGTGRFHRLGTFAAWLTAAGYTVVALVNAVSMIQGERSLVTVRLGAAGAILIGSAILGVISLVTHLLPWWCGVLLIIAFPLGDVANALFSGAENVLLALLWGSVGIALLTRSAAVARSVAAQPAPVG